MARFMVDYRFSARSGRTIEADSLDAAKAQIEEEVNTDDFHIDADEIDDVDFTIQQLHPVMRGEREVWTTYILPTDRRGHASALKETPLFAEAA